MPQQNRDNPVLVWDGDCDFCRRSAERLRDIVGDALDIKKYQEVHESFEGLEPEDFEDAVHLVYPDGDFRRGAAAILAAGAMGPGTSGFWWWAYRNVPGVAAVAETVYRFVADHRGLVGRWSRRLVGEDLRPSRWDISRWVFLRCLGLVALIAFLSLGFQLDGLAGPAGIAPVADAMDRFSGAAGERGWWTIFTMVPSLFWWIEPTRTALYGVCALGGLFSITLIAGIWPRGSLAGAWVTYLSFATTLTPFMGYQWDSLLLESLFLGLFLAPPGLWPSWRPRRIGRAAIFVFHWLAFRLMFMSGAVKLLSGDATWWNLTALRYHFWTQPIPNWISWWVDQLPVVLLDAMTLGALVLELAVPFLIFAPRKLRHVGALGLALLQVGILTTGNYGAFNLLTLAVLVLLVDDSVWRRWIPSMATGDLAQEVPHHRRRPRSGTLRRVGLGCVVAFVLVVTTVNMTAKFTGSRGGAAGPFPAWLVSSVQSVNGFRTLNNYGLFADMTEARPELQVQGSRDGEDWKTYEFRWKPGDPSAKPPVVAPHMPRLDWQMWFQALRWKRAHETGHGCSWSQWYLRFNQRLLEGEESVTALLRHNPFEGQPPTYIRTVVWSYTFTDLGASDWWQRERKGIYCPALTLKNGSLEAAKNSAQQSGETAD
jgi:predicted DCC family thiol-disulfide oxidoreductase YuxK